MVEDLSLHPVFTTAGGFKALFGNSFASPSTPAHSPEEKRLSSGKESHSPARNTRSKRENDEEEKIKKIKILLDKFEGKTKEQRKLGLDITIDRKSQEPVFQIVDRDTGDVISEIPPDYLLKLSKSLEEMKHLFIDEVS